MPSPNDCLFFPKPHAIPPRRLQKQGRAASRRLLCVDGPRGTQETPRLLRDGIEDGQIERFRPDSQAIEHGAQELLEHLLAPGHVERREMEAERTDPAMRKERATKRRANRGALPPHLPRRDVTHEPADTACGCGQPMQRIGEDVAEKLDYQPGVFTVERHVRGKWVCRCCEKLIQAPVPAHVIDKGIASAQAIDRFQVVLHRRGDRRTPTRPLGDEIVSQQKLLA